jgi:glyoxylase-like metal-dependent hydrolase (beta-lactamase superfamily II)/rhodanese-related sulfurtransferase
MSQFPDLDVRVPYVTAERLKRRIDAGGPVTVLDTRRPADFAAWHVSGPNVRTVNVPFTRFLDGDDPAESVPEGVPDGPMVTCCAKGLSSVYVAEFLTRAGYDVKALEEGMLGWAGLYEYRELDVDVEGVTVAQYHRPSSGCLAYLVVSGEEAAVIDPLRAFADEYVADARALGADIVYAIDTHVHADHISGVREVAERSGARVVLPEGSVGRGLAFDSELVGGARLPDSGTEPLEDGDRLPLGETTVEAVSLPGHTTEMTGYRVGDVFITGDTLFLEGVARPDLEEGAEGAPEAARRLFGTLRSVFALTDETVVAPGHAAEGDEPAPDGTYTRRLGDLRASLSLPDDREAFVDRSLADVPPRPNNYQRVIATNLGREAVADDEAFELELGPNNCAAGPASPADD